MVLFIMLYKVVLTSKAVDETLVCMCVPVHTEQYFHLVLFIMLYKVVLNTARRVLKFFFVLVETVAS